jgi:hypothetical protein
MTTLHEQGNRATKSGKMTETDASVITSHIGHRSGQALASEVPAATRVDDRRAFRRGQMPAAVLTEIKNHKYEVGQVVNFTPGKLNLETSPGRYEVVRHLPPDGSENQYRVRSVEDSHERVVRESQLA